MRDVLECDAIVNMLLSKRVTTNEDESGGQALRGNRYRPDNGIRHRMTFEKPALRCANDRNTSPRCWLNLAYDFFLRHCGMHTPWPSDYSETFRSEPRRRPPP